MKAKYLEKIQKVLNFIKNNEFIFHFSYFSQDITTSCLDICFKEIKKEVKFECFDRCSTKYIKTLETVHRELKKIGYENHSMYAYKIYPEFNFWPEIFMRNSFILFKYTQPHFLEDHVNNRKA